MDSNSRNAMVGLAQSRDRLEDRRGKDDKMSRGVWKAVEANVRKIRVVETKERRSKERSRKEMRGESKETEKEVEKGKDSGSEESGRRMGDMGQRRRSGKIRSRSKEVGSREISQVNKSLWQETIGEDAY